MFDNDCPPRKTFCLGCPYIVLAEYVKHTGARHTSNACGIACSESNNWQHIGGSRLNAGQWKPLKIEREYNLKHNSHPKNRRGNTKNRKRHKRTVKPSSVVDGGNNTHYKTQHHGKDIGTNCQLQRYRKRLAHKCNDGFLLHVRSTKIAMQHFAKPICILFRHGLIQTHGMAHLLDGLLVSHVAHHNANRISRNHI